MGSRLDLSHGDIEEVAVVATQMTEKISFLNLSLNQISSLGDLTKFTSLKCLDLTGNSLGSIQGISILKGLEILSLADNNLETEAVESEPLGNLTCLKRLNINGNRLDKVPLSICDIQQLTHLGLAENRITHLPSRIEKMSNLCYLSVKDNNIKTSNTDFTKMPSLRGLAVVGNPIADSFVNGILAHISVVQLEESNLNTPEVPVTRSSMMALSPTRGSSLLKVEALKG